MSIVQDTIVVRRRCAAKRSKASARDALLVLSGQIDKDWHVGTWDVDTTVTRRLAAAAVVANCYGNYFEDSQ